MSETAVESPKKASIADDVRGLHLVEFLLGIVLMLEGVITPGIATPVSYVGVFLLALLGLMRKPSVRWKRWTWVFPLLAVLMIYVAFISMLSTNDGGSDWTRRFARLVGVLLLTYVIGTGRIHVASLIKGLAFGLIGNAALFVAGIAPDTYAGALSGYLGDKNKAGLYYAVGGILLISVLKSLTMRLIATVLFAGLLWITESRTSMTAYALGVFWAWAIAPRLWFIRWAAAVAINFFVEYLETNFAQAGVFEERWGSDLLRGRIDAATAEKVAAAPWYGAGLGQAFVIIAGESWYFHSSYNTLLIEGGWPYAIGIVLITVVVGLRPFSAGDTTLQGRVTQGATVVMLICAMRLGEVFMTIPWAIVIGASLVQAQEPVTSATETPSVGADPAAVGQPQANTTNEH